jgi:hypothetical protein
MNSKGSKKMKKYISKLFILITFLVGYVCGNIGISFSSALDDNVSVEAPKLYTADIDVEGTFYENDVIRYKNKTYLEIGQLATALGKRLDISNGWINIGNHVYDESLLPSTVFIGETMDVNYYKKILEKPKSIKTEFNECLSENVTEYRFDGVIFNDSGSIEVSKPVLKTYRGVTIGSSKNYVILKYGKPNKMDSSDDYWIYGDYKVGIWFQFKENKVISFGKHQATC